MDSSFYDSFPQHIMSHYSIFYWYFRNHSYHHLVKGAHKGNYNIILPGGDHILGTYRGCIDNTEYCKTNEHSICTRQEKEDVLEHGYKFCSQTKKGKKNESVTPSPSESV